LRLFVYLVFECLLLAMKYFQHFSLRSTLDFENELAAELRREPITSGIIAMTFAPRRFAAIKETASISKTN